MARLLPYNTVRRLPSYWLYAFVASLLVTFLAYGMDSSAQTHTIETGAAADPAGSTFSITDPVTNSMRATEELASRFQAQQHRFQTNSNRRQLRPKRPEPGEVEVTREDEMIPPSDPLRNTLRSILPRDR
jgi:hypothetical protein